MTATVTRLVPGSPEWLRYVTASKVAAILGVSTYDSPRSLWHKMRGDVEPEPTKKNQARGHYLEPGVLNWFFDQHPELEPVRDVGTFVHENGWSAASPDALAIDRETGIVYPVEAKTDGGDGPDWGTAGTDEIPIGYAGQCIWTAYVLGATKVFVPMLAPRLEFREYIVDFDAGLAADIVQQCKAFLDTLDGETPPPLDTHPATFETLKRVNPNIVKDSDVQLTREQAALYVSAVTELKAAEARHNLAKSTIAEAMGTGHKAYYGGDLVARRQNTASGVAALYAAKPLPTIPEEDAA